MLISRLQEEFMACWNFSSCFSLCFVPDVSSKGFMSDASISGDSMTCLYVTRYARWLELSSKMLEAPKLTGINVQ
ncbi:hypothetical protein ACU8KH_03894 [Lachancea thermotolerans]